MRTYYSRILFILGVMIFTSCSQNEVLNSLPAKQLCVQTRNFISSSEEEDYKVSNQMLWDYLRLVKKADKVENTLPLIREGDTLAYCVQYTQGWDVISGDQRLSPTMMTSDNGEFETSASGIYDSSVEGLLSYIKSIRNSNNTEKNSIWSFLKPKVRCENLATYSTNDNEGYVVGMWIPEDTIYEENTIKIPHILETQWWQDTPWNQYTPLKIDTLGNLVNAKVGCNVVAVAQIIYSFRKNNPRDCILPTALRPLKDVSELPDISTFTTGIWKEMAESMNSAEGMDYTAAYLAYLGQNIMGVTYGAESTVVDMSDLRSALNWAKLSYTESSSYSFSTVLAYVRNGSPVCIHSLMESNSATEGKTNVHYFLIDRYKIESNDIKMHCRWNDSYKVSEEEYNSNPPELFVPNGEDEMDITLSQETRTYFGMKWGNTYCTKDDVFYLVRTQTAASFDEAGEIPPTDHIYTPYWSSPLGTTGAVRNMVYNFAEKVSE